MKANNGLRIHVVLSSHENINILLVNFTTEIQRWIMTLLAYIHYPHSVIQLLFLYFDLSHHSYICKRREHSTCCFCFKLWFFMAKWRRCCLSHLIIPNLNLLKTNIVLKASLSLPVHFLLNICSIPLTVRGLGSSPH